MMTAAAIQSEQKISGIDKSLTFHLLCSGRNPPRPFVRKDACLEIEQVDNID